ncbi:MAG: hypothetical protein ABI690_34190 [Chloroflexota bacterium]
MNIQKSPNTLEKLELLGDSTQFEPAGDQPASEARPTRKREIPPCISDVQTPTSATAITAPSAPDVAKPSG